MSSDDEANRYVDLHLHTTWSDGRWSPTRVVEEAYARGLAAISITDHDVVGGLAETGVRAAELGVATVAGIELTADWDGRSVHILGYGIDPGDRPLRVALDRGRRLMAEHVDRVLARLRAAGEAIEPADLERYRARYPGGASLVLAMVRRGVPRRLDNGAELLRLASREPRAYSAAGAIGLIHGAGGVASLAHPARIRRRGGVASPRPDAGARPGSGASPPLHGADELAPLVAFGLDGIEVWQVVHGDVERRHYARIADELGLLRTGGSDCHGPERDGGPRVGSQAVPYAVFERLSAAITARRDDRASARA